MHRKYLFALSVVLVMVLIGFIAAQAAIVGRFVHVEGHVDLLKQGKLPALPVKVQDGVEPGDVVRTKGRSKAQVAFVDDSTITLAPESRVAIADFVFDPARNERRAVLKVFRGLTHTVVRRILQVHEPDFLMESMTAAIGVRGTEWYTLLKPNATFVYLLTGLLGVRSSDPRIPDLLLLRDMQFTQVLLGLPPSPARPITPADLDMLKKLMDTGVPDVALFAPPGEGRIPPPFRRPVDPEKAMPPYIPPVIAPGQVPHVPSPPSWP